MLVIYTKVSLIGDPWVTPEVTPEGVLTHQEEMCDNRSSEQPFLPMIAHLK